MLASTIQISNNNPTPSRQACTQQTPERSGPPGRNPEPKPQTTPPRTREGAPDPSEPQQCAPHPPTQPVPLHREQPARRTGGMSMIPLVNTTMRSPQAPRR